MLQSYINIFIYPVIILTNLNFIFLDPRCSGRLAEGGATAWSRSRTSPGAAGRTGGAGGQHGGRQQWIFAGRHPACTWTRTVPPRQDRQQTYLGQRRHHQTLTGQVTRTL